MKLKSELYKKEQNEIVDKIISILDLDKEITELFYMNLITIRLNKIRY